VGKAQKYKELTDELKGLDIYVSKQKIHEFDVALEQNAANRQEIEKAIEEATNTVAEAEAKQQELHRELHQLEESLQFLAQEQASADGAYRRANEVIGVNAQRIEEYRAFSERDGREIADTRRQLEEVEMQLESLAQKTQLLADSLDAARAALEEAEASFSESQQRIDSLRLKVQSMRMESVQCDRTAAQIRDEIASLEVASRKAVMRNETLKSEEVRLEASFETVSAALEEVRTRASQAKAMESEAQSRHELSKQSLEELRTQIQDARDNLGEMQAQAAAKEAQLAMLKDEAKAKGILENIFENSEGGVRIAAVETGKEGVVVKEGDRLVEHLALSEDQIETAEQLLGDMVLAGGKNGVWLPSTSIEPLSGHKSPITEAETQLEELNAKIAFAKETLSTGAERIASLAQAVSQSEAELAEARRKAAQAEGEASSLVRDYESVKNRLEQVTQELQDVAAEGTADDARREELTATLAETLARRDACMDSVGGMQDELQALETANVEESRRLTERRIAASQMEQEISFVGRQGEVAKNRREELSSAIQGRSDALLGYEDSIKRLTEESGELLASLDDLKAKAEECRVKMEDERARRGEMMSRLSQADAILSEKRTGLDKARDFRSRLEVQAAEETMRRQNVYAHLQDEYGLFADAVLREPDPEWKNGVVPPLADLEKKVATLQSSIAELGPVNMVAIDECRELEERYAREKAQEEDLIAAKAQIAALIADLNTKSGELFKNTFETANKNFQKMFTTLFGGGEARLVLLENADDPLECGIDIIARPPGKRPQSVTLLSGGERTMTAVALLFSIFMIKPAPFCMLDELDAALDDANIGRFVEQLKEFLVQSQFLIITHNQHTIAGSDIVYGVSQQEKGVSRVISMRLSDLGVKEK
jgi:chromosome segregation protein